MNPAHMEQAPHSHPPAQNALAPTSNLGMLSRLELPLTVCFGSKELTLNNLLALSPGAVLELDRKLQDPVDLLINGTLIARGEIASVDGSFGIRITHVV